MAERVAILVGTAQYTHLPPVPAAANSLYRMRDLLIGPCCGWQPGQVTVLADEQAPGTIPDQLVEAFSVARDIALFYFVGHGLPDHDDRLCLGLVGTQIHAIRRYTTSLPFDAVRDAIRLSPARFKVVLLDCCYAGLAVGDSGRLGPGAERDIEGRIRGTGAFVMAACGPYSSAWYENEPANPEPYTHFTKRLAEVVEAGAGAPGELSLGRLAEQLTEKLAADGKPVPTWLGRDQAAGLVFAKYPSRAGAVSGTAEGEAPPPGAPTTNWGADLPAPLAYEASGGNLAPSATKARLYPDVPARVWEIGDPGERAGAVLDIGFRLAETDSAQARRVFAAAEQLLHTDVKFLFTRYRLLIRAAEATRSSMPAQARRFLGLAAACAAGQEGDRLFATAREDLRRLYAALPAPGAASATP